MRHFKNPADEVFGYDDTQPDLIAAAIAAGWPELAVWPLPVTPVVPSVVTMRQARLALLDAGLLPDVNATVAAMAGTAGDAARIEWEFAATVDRNSPLVANLSVELGLTDPQLDALFTEAIDL